MGDRREGPHLEICQLGTVSSPTSKENSALFEDGICTSPVTILTVPPMDSAGVKCQHPTPSVLASVEIAALGKATRNGRFSLPKRNGIAETTDGGLFNVETTNEATALPPYQGKKLSYTSQGAVLMPLSCQ